MINQPKNITLNEKFINHYFQSINKHQAYLLDLNYPPKKKWKKRLVGKSFSEEIINMVISCKKLNMTQRDAMLNKYNGIEKTVPSDIHTLSAGRGKGIYKIADNSLEMPKKINLVDIKNFYKKINNKTISKTAEKQLKKKVAIFNSKLGSTNTEESSNIYLIDGGGWFKIGKADDIEKRIKALQTAFPHKLTCICKIKVRYPFDVEKFLHALFGQQRLEGEWFKFTDEQLRLVKQCFKRFDESAILN